MDDSDQDFVDFSSKLLKRFRKKPGEAAKPSRTVDRPTSGQTCAKEQRGRKPEEDSDGQEEEEEEEVTFRGGPQGPGDAASASLSAAQHLRAKDKVLLQMQKFKRSSPQKMGLTKAKPCRAGPSPPRQEQDGAASLSSGSCAAGLQGDEALALRLQLQMDQEAAEAQAVDLEDGGLFFCQICQRDLSHMTAEGRTHHLNRCLDESEAAGSAPSLSSGGPDCPICGKKFQSQKSFWAHLKRCSSDMGVSAAELLQALQARAQEGRSAASSVSETAGSKRKSSSKSKLPLRKKFRRKKEPLDEETLVALALSTSLLEKERVQQKEEESVAALQSEAASSHCAAAGVLKWRSDGGRGHGKKKKKAAAPRPPPLLLVQDAETVSSRLQERVSALLLRCRDPSPPTPTRQPSTLPGRTGDAPLWCLSALSVEGCAGPPSFCVAELQEFFTPSGSIKTPSSTHIQPNLSLPSVGRGPPATDSPAPAPPLCSQNASFSLTPPTPRTGELSVGSQALRDLMELAEDGMTLTQYGYSTAVQHLSGFIQEDSEQPVEICSSRLLGEAGDSHIQAEGMAAQSGEGRDAHSHRPAALSRLSADLSGMVNNPQLSDVQLQVDSGEVYHAHSFMVYARCPLLAEMLHESGFTVQEEGSPAAQRVVLSDVPGQAVFMLLQYLYTAQCSVPAALQPHMLELASRFDLQELQQLSGLPPEDATTKEREENDLHTDQAFLDLLRSMWNEDEDAAADLDEGGGDGKQQISEEPMNEEELEEIYEFAATQKKEEEESEDEEEQEEAHVLEPRKSFFEECDQSSDGCGQKTQTVQGAEPSSTSHRRWTQSRKRDGSDGPFLQSSGSSLSPPPRTFSLPGPGLSPGPVDGVRGDQTEASPDTIRPLQKEGPDFIVLSDSDDEKHFAPDKSYTQIRSRQDSLESSPPEGSPEVSWLTFTPVQAGRSSRSSSTQTRSSMCRTKLFSGADSSAAFSSPGLSSGSKRPTCSRHQDVSVSSSQSCVSGLKQNPVRRRSLGPEVSAEQKQTPSRGSALPLPQSCISTPLQTDHHQPAASPLHADIISQRRGFHVSPSASSSSSCARGGPSPHKLSPSPSRRPPSESSSWDSPGFKVQAEAGSDADADVEQEAGRRLSGESSAQQSFMDEPPIAYDDSWGLDVCEEADPARFSLRLEDGSGSSLQETSRTSSVLPAEAGGMTSDSVRQSPPPPRSCLSPTDPPSPESHSSFFESRLWDSWREEEEELPLSQRVNPAQLLKTPASSHRKRRVSVVPITPMPSFSDMDTPELKGKLNRFGVRPLPKRQMILKLKEIHQYTHQLASSDSEEDTPPQREEPPSVSCDQFKEPRAPAAAPAVKPSRGADAGQLSASQGSNTSSAGCSDESERSNQEFLVSSDGDSDSDGCISSSQAATRLQDRLQAVRNFILSHPELYGRILQYQPLVLSRLQEQLKAAGIRLGAAKLVDYLDSQCITFTTAKPGRPAPGRCRGNRAGGGAKAGSRKKAATANP